MASARQQGAVGERLAAVAGRRGRPATYFHNGIADTLAEAVEFYEVSVGFDFTTT
jgi:hypothetical protein